MDALITIIVVLGILASGLSAYLILSALFSPPLFKAGDVLVHEHPEHWEKDYNEPKLEILDVGKNKYRVKSLPSGEISDIIFSNVEPFYKVAGK